MTSEPVAIAICICSSIANALETLKPALLQEESGHSGFTPPQVG
jgi:hypothetical protein